VAERSEGHSCVDAVIELIISSFYSINTTSRAIGVWAGFQFSPISGFSIQQLVWINFNRPQGNWLPASILAEEIISTVCLELILTDRQELGFLLTSSQRRLFQQSAWN
jgi:hypothetical protein